MYNVQMAAFIEQIHNAEHPLGNAKNGLINMLILDAAYESTRSGQLILFEPSKYY